MATRALVTIVANKGGDSGQYNVKAYGATGDGATDDRTAIYNAVTAATANGGCVYFPQGTYKISSNLTIGCHCQFVKGAILSVDSAMVLSITGNMDAGLYQIFSGSGTVSIAMGAAKYILPQWWGAKGDGVTDDTLAINTAIDVASQKLAYSVAPKVREVFLPNGIYKITSPLAISYSTSLRGNGMNSTIIDVYGDINGINVSVTVTVEPYENPTINNLRIRNRGTAGVGYGINMVGIRGATIKSVWIGGWYTQDYYFERGINILNSGSYYNTISRCMLMKNTYQIYLNGYANDTRIVENDIWYGDYGVYILRYCSSARILNNTIESYTQKGVYANGEAAIISHNYFESPGLYSVELGPYAERCEVYSNTCSSNLWSQSDVLNNSTSNYNRINDEYIPIGYHTLASGRSIAAKISCDLDGTYANNTTIEAITGALILKGGADYTNKWLRLYSPVKIDPNGAVINAINNESLTVKSSDTKYPASTIYGGSNARRSGANNGQLMIGAVGNSCGSIAYDWHTSNTLFIDNTINDSNSGIQLRTKTSLEGNILTVSINAAGSGYSVDDKLTVVQTGAFDGVVNVSTIDGSGGVTGVTVYATGKCYTVATGLSVTGGTGSSCTINVLTVGAAVINMALQGSSVGLGAVPAYTNYQLNVKSSATNQPAAIFYGGSTLGTNTSNGQVIIGAAEHNRSVISHDYQYGNLTYIDNTYDGTGGGIRFRTRTYGTPVNALQILGSGKIGVNTVAPEAQLSINGGLHVGGTTDPGDNNLTVDGETKSSSLVMSYRGISATTTVLATDYCVNVTANTFSLYLPTAVGLTGKIYVIKNSGSGVVTVDANDSETIDGSTTQGLNQYDSITVMSDGANWIII